MTNATPAKSTSPERTTRHPFLDRQYATGRDHADGHRPVPALREAGESEPDRLDQGPDRALDDRGSRAGRKVKARGHDYRSDRGQHRPRARTHRGRERLSHHPRHSRQDVAGENCPRPRARGGSSPNEKRRDPRASGILPGRGCKADRRNSGRVLRQPIRQPGQSSRARDRRPARKSGSK